MELFQKVITVTLSHDYKYLVAEDNKESVYLDRDGSLKNEECGLEHRIRRKQGKLFAFRKLLWKTSQGFERAISSVLSVGRKVLQILQENSALSTEWG